MLEKLRQAKKEFVFLTQGTFISFNVFESIFNTNSHFIFNVG